MKISYSKDSQNPQTFDIYLDNIWVKKVHAAIFSQKYMENLCQKQCQDNWEEYFQKIEYKRSKYYALLLLNKKSLSLQELSKRLKERLVSHKTLEEVLEYLQQLGYINDKNLSENVVNLASNLSKIGPARIYQKLKKKGIDGQIIQNSLATFDENAQKKVLLDLLKTRYKRYNLQNLKDRQKVWRSLIRKGFSTSTISSFIQDFLSNEV